MATTETKVLSLGKSMVTIPDGDVVRIGARGGHYEVTVSNEVILQMAQNIRVAASTNLKEGI